MESNDRFNDYSYEAVFNMGQSLPLVEQPTGINYICMIFILFLKFVFSSPFPKHMVTCPCWVISYLENKQAAMLKLRLDVIFTGLVNKYSSQQLERVAITIVYFKPFSFLFFSFCLFMSAWHQYFLSLQSIPLIHP